MTDKSSTGADVKEVKTDVKEVKADVKEVKSQLGPPEIDKSELPLALGDKNVRPLTTAEEDRKTQGQRNTNLMWEATQSVIAVIVTIALIYTSVMGIDAPHLATAFTSIILLYFVRTNHTKIGGVGGTDSRTR